MPLNGLNLQLDDPFFGIIRPAQSEVVDGPPPLEPPYQKGDLKLQFEARGYHHDLRREK